MSSSSTSTSKGLVLLTGGTGHIGFRVLVEALQAGYTVRTSVRRESSIEEIKSAASVKPFLERLSFVVSIARFSQFLSFLLLLQQWMD